MIYFVVNSCDGRRRILTFTTRSGRYSGDQIRYVEVATKAVDFVVCAEEVCDYPDKKGYCKMKGVPKIKAVGLEINCC